MAEAEAKPTEKETTRVRSMLYFARCVTCNRVVVALAAFSFLYSRKSVSVVRKCDDVLIPTMHTIF